MIVTQFPPLQMDWVAAAVIKLIIVTARTNKLFLIAVKFFRQFGRYMLYKVTISITMEQTRFITGTPQNSLYNLTAHSSIKLGLLTLITISVTVIH